MRRFKDILFCPLARRDNPAALRQISGLVEQAGAKLTLFGVVPEPSRMQRLLNRPGAVDDMVAAERRHIEKDLARWSGQGSIDATMVVDEGDVALRTIERVVTHGHDLVVATSDEDREDRATIRRLLRECPCPVWVIRPTRARTQRVLAAVNPHPSELVLNRTILELASAMVDLHGGELHLVHAWELYGEAAMRSSAFVGVSAAELAELLELQRQAAGEALHELLEVTEMADRPWKVHLKKGPAARVVPHLVAKRHVNLLVMGTVARVGVSAAVMGNTAERVLDEVGCSVIAVKPEGFVSPIRARTG